MNYKLPDFEAMVAMAKEDPEALDQLRKEASEAIIDGAREGLQQRLRGLQFQIDMEVRRSKSPLAACIKISGMMHTSLAHFRDTMQNCVGKESTLADQKTKKQEPAQILPFHSYS